MAAYRPLPIANQPDICICPHKRSDAATATCARIALAVNELRDVRHSRYVSCELQWESISLD